MEKINIDKPEFKSKVQAQSQIEKGKKNLDHRLSLKSYRPMNTVMNTVMNNVMNTVMNTVMKPILILS